MIIFLFYDFHIKREWSEHLQLCRNRKSRNTRKNLVPASIGNKIYFSQLSSNELRIIQRIF